MGKLYYKLLIILSIPSLAFGADPKAERIRIEDGAGYYVGTNVEAALQEVGDLNAGVRYDQIIPPLTSHGIGFGSFTNTWTSTIGNANFFTIDTSGSTDFIVQGDGDVTFGGDPTFNGGEVTYGANTTQSFSGFTNVWTSTGASGDFFTIGNATNGTILSTDRSGKIVLGGATAEDSMAIRPMCTRTICSSTTSFRNDSCDYVTDGTDDDVQIQAAITDIKSGTAQGFVAGGSRGKGSLCFTEGTFTIGSSVEFSPGISLYGQGITATYIKAKNSLNANMFQFTEETQNPSAGVLIRGIFFDGNDSNNTSGSIIDTKTGSIALWDLQIEDSYFFECAGDCLTIDDPWGFRLEQSHIEDCGALAIKISKGASKTEGAIITESKIIQCNGGGIQLNDVDGTVIIGNEINCDTAGCWAVDIIQGTTSGNGNIISNNKFWGGVNGVRIRAGATANNVTNNILAGLSGTEIQDLGTNSQIVNNRGDDNGTNTSYTTNAWTFTGAGGNFFVNSGQNASDFAVGSDNENYLLAVAGALDQVRMGDSNGSNYTQVDVDGDLTFEGTADYLVPAAKYAFRYSGDEDAGLAFGTGYEFRDLNANVSARINLSGTFQLLTQASAPATCTVGEIYFDTSGAFCACTATNTWENTVATGTCS